jgi:hypothetical protein
MDLLMHIMKDTGQKQYAPAAFVLCSACCLTKEKHVTSLDMLAK